MSEEPPPPPTFHQENGSEAPSRRGYALLFNHFFSRTPTSFKSSFGRSTERESEERPRFRAGGGRIFVGNLEAEKVTRDEFKSIFEAHGQVVEVSLHSSYGFVQFAKEEDMQKAMEAEQGRLIGSRKIDIERAKEKRRNRKDRDRDFRNGNGNKRRRDYGRDRDFGGRGRRRTNNSHFNGPKPALPPKDGSVMKIILLGEMQRDFAESVANKIRKNVIPVELEMLDGRNLSQALRDAEANRSRYVCIVGRENINKGTTTIKLLHLREEGNRCPTYDLETEDLVDLVVSEEKRLGFDVGPKPLAYGNTPGPGYPLANPAMVNPLQNPAAPGLMPQQPNLLMMQQQLAALSQQISTISQPNQAPIQSYQQPLPQQPNPAVMQLKIMEELSRLQQQAAQLQQPSHTHPPTHLQQYHPPQSNTVPNMPVSSNKGASPETLANLSKLLGTIQKLKGNK